LPFGVRGTREKHERKTKDEKRVASCELRVPGNNLKRVLEGAAPRPGCELRGKTKDEGGVRHVFSFAVCTGLLSENKKMQPLVAEINRGKSW